MRKKKVARLLGFAAVLLAVVLTVFWYVGHRPIAYHNRTLRNLIGSATQIELSLVPQYGADGYLLESDPPIVLTNRSEIDRVLHCFELPWHLRASDRFHECAGHLVVRVRASSSDEYKIRYDHGKGIYPIHLEEDFPGFCDLPVESCRELNKTFNALGFSDTDLGI